MDDFGGNNLEIIANTIQFYIERPTAVAIGKFDGVHVGHRRLLEEIIERKKSGLAACVFTFDPPPAVLFGFSDGKELTTREEKRAIFERMGVDILVEFPLNKETAAMPPMEFATQVLARQMNAEFVVAGDDLSFGDKGAGDAELLKRLGPDLGYSLKTIEKVKVDDKEVSSTDIRTLVEHGKMEQVERMLGAPYMIMGTVAHGNRIGRTLGFPTLNLLPPADKLMPPNGVYDSYVTFEGKKYKGISNVGYKPTVTDEKVMGIETYLYDFDREIYGENIEVELYSFRRPEKRFNSLDELKAQLDEDIRQGMRR